LHRSWGDFPDRAGTLPPGSPSTPDRSRRPAAPLDRASRAATRPPGAWVEPLLMPTEQEAEASGGMVLIEHPLLRQVAEEAWQRGAEAAKYLVRDGDRLYLALDRIPDSAQRQAISALLKRIQSGERVDIGVMMKLIRQFLRR
jgi:hypothetical protein